MRQVALDRLHQHLGLHAVEIGQIGIEHHALLAQRQDAAADQRLQRRLREASATNGYSRKLAYDSLGRPATTTRADVAGGTGTYQDDLSYDSRGKVATRTYPGAAGQRLSVRHTYTTLGYLKSVSDGASGKVYWSAGQQDEYGNLTQQTYGNGVVTTRSHDFMKRLLTSTAGAGNAVQNDSYGYDLAGNLRRRTETRSGAILTAQYDFDNLDRVKTEARSGGAVTGTQTLTWAYNDIGNIASRSDVGTYTYPAAGAARPHAVSSITGTVNGVVNPTYTYDANGNILTSAGRTGTWTSFNLPATLTRGTNQLSWLYDSEHERVREQLRVNGTLTRTTVYVNPGAGAGLFYEEEIAGSVLKRRHYVSGGEGAMAVLTRQSGVADQVRYWHKDHLDSNTVVTDEAGAVVERLAYEPFGKRRKADNTTDAAGTLTALSTDRGYTEHEMLDEVGLVHMNGRLYDPAIGRFLSADPNVPHPQDMQSYNRYTYVRNRPLSLVDPSGFQDFVRGSSGSLAEGNYLVDIPNLLTGGGIATGNLGTSIFGGAGNTPGFDAVCTWNTGKLAPNASAEVPKPLLATIPGRDYDHTSAPAVAQTSGGWLVDNVLNPAARVTEPMIRLGPVGGQVPLGLKAMVFLLGVRKVTQESATAVKAAVNWKSVKQFGHTFSEHGAGAKNAERLLDRARGTGNPQGQWLNNEKAAEALSAIKVDGPATIRIPGGLGQVIKADGTVVSTEWATVVPRGDGLRTAYPIVGP